MSTTKEWIEKRNKKKWIQEAIEKPGSLTATAKKAGAVTRKGTIEKGWLGKKAKGKGKTAKRARLAETLSGLRGKSSCQSIKK